jgi:hypothetical protein
MAPPLHAVRYRCDVLSELLERSDDVVELVPLFARLLDDVC